MPDKRIDQYDLITPVGSEYILIQDPISLNYERTTVNTIKGSGSGAVSSVAGKTGAVTLVEGDITNLTSDLGTITSNISTNTTAIAGKEPAITAGTSAQYYRGDKTMQTLNQDAVPSGTTNKAYTATEQTKLSGIATGATANSPDATLLNRANHTGTQTASTISDFSTAADARITAAAATGTGSLVRATSPTLTTPNISSIINTGTLTLPTTTGTIALTSSNITGTAAGLSVNITESQVTNLVSDLAAKQGTLTLTTAGTSGAATLTGNTLNIPQYAGGGGGTAGITRSISNISVNTTAGAVTLTDYVYNCTGSITLTLPTAVGNTNSYTVNSTDGLTTVATTSSQTILGSLTATLPLAGMSLTFVSNGTNWIIE